ncbi:MAG: T9SS type A sorting domain-containing protein [Melioribacteraceae bacterium]
MNRFAKSKYYLTIIYLLLISSISFAQLLTFNLSNTAATGCANHMNNNIYAFDQFSYDGTSSSVATVENMTAVSGTVGLSYTITPFTLKYYKHINVVNANGNSSTSGERGDSRIYSDGTITIKDNGVTKLTLTNCISQTKVSWPGWMDGSGDDVVGSGWGTIDVANSDASWVTEFDANGTGQIYIEYSSISNVVQGLCGDIARYDFVINLYPSNYSRTIITNSVSTTLSLSKTTSTVDMSQIDLSFNFSAATNGGSGNDKNDLYAEFRNDSPGGTTPLGINTLGSDGFWNIGTTLGSFTTTVTFNLDSYDGITDINDIKMLRRVTEDADWEIYSNQSVVGNTIVCTNINAFSQWLPGSSGNDPLPVELNLFTASVKKNKVLLEWQTATEINNYGFEVARLRSKKLNFAEAGWQTFGFVEGHGNSNSQKNYMFIDDELQNGNYFYRLKQINIDGSFVYADVVEISIDGNFNFQLYQNYPNPFNPSTTIQYSIPNITELGVTNVKLNVYDILGKRVATLIDKEQPSGNYKVIFDAFNLPSGVYHYQLKAGSFIETKKFILLK